MFYTVGKKYIYASILLWYYRFTRRRARASAFIPWSLFSEALYPQTKPKWNKCTFLGESIASREYVLSRFYMHKTVLRLLAGLWTLLVATIVFISNISFDNKGKAVTLFDILCWCFSNKLTLGVLVFKVDVVFFSSETYNKKCKNISIFFLVSLLMISKIIKLTLFATCARGTLSSSSSVLLSSELVLVCSRSDDRHCGDNDTQNLSVPLSQFRFLFLRSEFCLYDMNCFQKEKEPHHAEQITPDFKLPAVCANFFLR